MENFMSESIKELATALSKMQSELDMADKNREAYSCKYADLPRCLETLKIPLTKNGLSISQLLVNRENGKPSLITLLLHSSGEWLKSTLDIEEVASKQCNNLQRLGIGITYVRRYAILAIAGLSSKEDDTDAHGIVAAQEEDDNKTTLYTLLDLCKKNNIDAKQFATFHHIKSDELDTVKHAIENWEALKQAFISTSISIN